METFLFVFGSILSDIGNHKFFDDDDGRYILWQAAQNNLGKLFKQFIYDC